MRKLLLALAAGIAAVCLSGSLLLGQDFKTERGQVKERQKAERKALKLKHKFTSESMKSQEIPKSQRQMMKHQMEREERELREKHRDEMQDLRDRQRALKESQGSY
ncbi:MAG: hypothetical protein ACE145_19200 [Terriglobia bacterium]